MKVSRIPARSNVHGFTLIELIVVIVVIGIGLSGLLIAAHQATRDSVDPLFRQQATAIAQSYLEEVMLKPFCDPDDFASTNADCVANCTTSACSSCSGSSGESRATFDDVCDYDGLSDSDATDQNGSAIAGLSSYTVNVTVSDSGTMLGLDAGNGEIVRIDVQVQHDPPSNVSSSVSGYRVNY